MCVPDWLLLQITLLVAANVNMSHRNQPYSRYPSIACPFTMRRDTTDLYTDNHAHSNEYLCGWLLWWLTIVISRKQTEYHYCLFICIQLNGVLFFPIGVDETSIFICHIRHCLLVCTYTLAMGRLWEQKHLAWHFWTVIVEVLSH